MYTIYIYIYIYISTHTYISLSLSPYTYICIERERDIGVVIIIIIVCFIGSSMFKAEFWLFVAFLVVSPLGQIVARISQEFHHSSLDFTICSPEFHQKFATAM